MGCCSSLKSHSEQQNPRTLSIQSADKRNLMKVTTEIKGSEEGVSTNDVVLQLQDFPVSSQSSHQGSRHESARGRKYFGVLEALDMPKQVRENVELLEKTIKGESIGHEQVAAIRGLDREIPDSVQGASHFDEEPFGTVMWNPLYFAVHHGHLDLVKQLLKTVKLQSTVPKSNSENEKDPTNVVSFKEDKQLLLMIAYERSNMQMLSLLLNELHAFWPSNTVDYLLVQNYNEHLNNGMEPCRGLIKTVLSSKTAHSLYLNMSFKKRKEWLNDFAGNLKSSTSEEVFTEYLSELSLQPYAGNLLFYLLFEEYSDDKKLVEQVYSNITKVDLYIQMTNYESVEDYFEINRMIKLSEKFEETAVYEHMKAIVNQMVDIEQQGVYPTDFFQKIKSKLIHKAASPDTTFESFQQLGQQIYEHYKWDIYSSLTAIKSNKNIQQTSIEVNLRQLQADIYSLDDAGDNESALIAKWNPMTFAIYNANLPLIKFLFTYSRQRIKKLVKIPGLQSSDLNRLFPFYVALKHDSTEMFEYFWEDLGGYLYRQQHLESLFRLLVKRDAVSFIELLLRSQTTRAIFDAMSFCYRFVFIDRIIQQRAEILEEFMQNQSPMLKGRHNLANSQRGSENSNSINCSINNEDFSDAGLHQVRSNLSATFNKVYQLLSEEFPLYFFISLCKDLESLAQVSRDQLEYLRNAQEKITSDCIELFVYYQSDRALDIVKEYQTSSKSDGPVQKLLIKFAQQLGRCPGFSKIAAASQ